MKKQLLFTIAFLASITFASAQLKSSISFAEAGVNEQTFTVGQQSGDDLNDPSIVAVAGGGTVNENNSFFGINSPIGISTTSGSITFTVTTNSTSPISTVLNLDMGKRPGCSVSGKVSVTGYSDKSFSFGTDGTDNAAAQDIQVQFGSLISLVDTTPLTVTITLDQMLNVSNTTNAGIFRLENVILTKDGTLSTNSFDLKSFQVFPNPTADSFQISTEESITSVILTNVTGQVVKTFTSSENYNISDLNAGIYFATVTSDNGSQTVKIVKK